MNLKKLIFLFLFLSIFVGVVFGNFFINIQSFDKQRENIINDMNLAISEQVEKGNYRCCIDPPCTMCYLGNWIWDDGICRCDDMILEGEFDKVCPQCKKGLEEGICKSL
ncbi:MAG: hypothetical protein KJ674_02370 [Nanoarchaeota archaeon]|nr:hypothetical protein [Nanoarchaeota archaeon]